MVSTLQPKLYWVTPEGVAKDEALKLKTAELKTAYESLKNRITNLASSHGYFDGRFEVSSIRVNVIDNTAAVELIYASGTRYKIGEIRVTHDILSEAFLRRYLVVDTGDYYDTDKLLEIKNLYNKSNYFTVSTATPDLQNLENYLNS